MAMATLCSLKRTASFTQIQLEHWHAALSVYKIKTVNAAVLEVACATARFPDFADILQVCRRLEKPEIPYCPHGEGTPDERLTRREIVELADRLGLPV